MALLEGSSACQLGSYIVDSRALLHLLADADDSNNSLAHNGTRGLVQCIKCLRLACLPLTKPAPLLEGSSAYRLESYMLEDSRSWQRRRLR